MNLSYKLYNSVLKGSNIPKVSSLASILQAEIHMPAYNYSAAQSGLNFSNKIHEHIDYNQSFVVQKWLAVVSKTNKKNDIRKIITMSLLKQIIEALPNVLIMICI
jgi:hypothetical protein